MLLLAPIRLDNADSLHCLDGKVRDQCTKPEGLIKGTGRVLEKSCFWRPCQSGPFHLFQSRSLGIRPASEFCVNRPADNFTKGLSREVLPYGLLSEERSAFDM